MRPSSAMPRRTLPWRVGPATRSTSSRRRASPRKARMAGTSWPSLGARASRPPADEAGATRINLSAAPAWGQGWMASTRTQYGLRRVTCCARRITGALIVHEPAGGEPLLLDASDVERALTLDVAFASQRDALLTL